MYMLRSYLLYR